MSDLVSEELEAYRDQVEAITAEIRDRTVTIAECDGMLSATALATGQLVGLTISPRALRNFDAGTLAGHVLSMVQRVTAEAARARLESFKPLIGRERSFQEIFGHTGTVAEEKAARRTTAARGDDDDDFYQRGFLR